MNYFKQTDITTQKNKNINQQLFFSIADKTAYQLKESNQNANQIDVIASIF